MKNEEIQNLINCPKLILENPRKTSKTLQGSERNDFKLVAQNDQALIFRVFMRQNIKFPEHFSIGLEYTTPDNKDIKLVRYNGFHQHTNKVINTDKFEDFHIHTATQDALEEGLAAETFAIITKDYDTFEKALLSFWKDVNIIEDIYKYFDFLVDINIRQLKLDL